MTNVDPAEFDSYEEYMEYMDEMEGKSPSAQAAAPVAPPEAESTLAGASQAALENFGNKATMKYMPQIQAAAEGPMTSALNAITGENVELPSYDARVKENTARMSQERKDYPKSAAAGGFAGDLVTSLPIGRGLAAAKGASGLSRLLGAGAAYGLKGAAENPDEGSTRAQGALQGGIGGLLGQGLVEGLQVAPQAIKAGYKSVVPDGAPAWYDKLRGLVGEAPNDMKGLVSQYAEAHRSSPANVEPLKRMLIEANPAVAEAMAEKSSEMTGLGVRDYLQKKAWLGMLPGIARGNFVESLGGLAAGTGAAYLGGAAAGGGKEALRQMAKPATELTSPVTGAVSTSLLEALRSLFK
jgi:hypothetical protein